MSSGAELDVIKRTEDRSGLAASGSLERSILKTVGLPTTTVGLKLSIQSKKRLLENFRANSKVAPRQRTPKALNIWAEAQLKER